jgi:F0F1-type ATP synthase assembly protein I
MLTRKKFGSIFSSDRAVNIIMITFVLLIAFYIYFIERKTVSAIVFVGGFFSMLIVVTVINYARRKLRERIE